MMHLAVAALLALAQNDKTQANSYDDAWEQAWKDRCRTVLSGGTKTTGFVLQIGDSISHSRAYGAWIRGGANRTSEDLAIAGWCLATVGFSGSETDTNNKNGFYLSGADTSANRGMTASGSIQAAHYAVGNGNGTSPAMPADTTQSGAASKVADGAAYPRNLHITTVANAFPDAQFAVVMLGTNDATNGRTAAQLSADLTTIINTLEGKKIAVILSTIPPQISTDVTSHNTAIRSLAQSRSLPLIDYYAEILARQPGSAWQGTLIEALPDGRHPTGAMNGADPYNGPTGNAGTHKTGSNAANDGYLLRTWLTTQKLKEVHSYVILNDPVPGPGPGPGPRPTPTPTPTPSPSGGGGGGGGGKCGSSIGEPASPAALAIAVMAALALLGASRKSGF